MAVVNALGWDIDGQQNAEKFLKVLKIRYKVNSEDELAEKADAGTLLTYAYMKAMDDYFNVDKAKQLAERAVEKDTTKSLTIRLITAIIQGQYYMEDDWGDVYRVAARVVEDSSLKKDMKAEAVDDIWNYLKTYGAY